MELNSYFEQIKDATAREDSLRAYLHYAEKCERLEEILRELEQPDVWNDPERAKDLNREKTALEKTTTGLDFIRKTLLDSEEMLNFAAEEDDKELVETIVSDMNEALAQLEALEFSRMFSGEADTTNAYLDIQAGSGGTEAQDWASMLLRMYLRWAEAKGFAVDVVEESPGDVAGIKSATIHVQGEYAYGWHQTKHPSYST